MNQPPKIFLKILDKLCPEDRPDIKGDFLEIYEYRTEASRFKANLRLLTESISLLPLSLKTKKSQKSNNSVIMFKTHFKVARRNLAKNKIYSIINILGLTLGLTATVLITLFVRYELSYDKHYPEHNSVYRLVGSYDQGGDSRTEAAQTSYLLEPNLTPYFPELEIPVRLDFFQNMVSIDDQQYLESEILLADSNFFQVFQKTFISGSAASALKDPRSVVLTTSTASKYFGSNNPIGQSVEIMEESFQVTGVVNNFPANSHFSADLILPLHGIMHWYPNWVSTNPTGTSHYTYFKVSEGFNPITYGEKINQYVAENWDSDDPAEYTFQPLASIHLNSNLTAEIEANGSMTTVYIFSATAFIILLLAGVNYINLSLAGSLQRSKEVGIKRVLGATKSSQITQFQVESILTISISAAIAILLVWILTPYFNQLTERVLEFNPFEMPLISLGLILLLLIIGTVTGSFPSWLLLRMDNTEALSGRFTKTGTGGILQNFLIVFQFTIAVVLIASTFIVIDQMNFLLNKDLGVKKENLIIIPFQTREISHRYDLMKNEFLRDNGVLGITAANNNVTSRVGNWRPYRTDGAEENVTCPTVIVTHDFFDVMNANMIEGRPFSRDYPSDPFEAYVINESAVKFFEMETPVGSPLLGWAFTGADWSRKDAQVVGVVSDFHFASLHSEVRPTVFSLHSDSTIGLNYMNVRVSGEQIKPTLAHLETVWNDLNPERPFTFEFMEDEIQAHYDAENRFLKVFGIFSILSIVLGAIGLFGLTAFLMERRTKEIGIRKIMGASIPKLISTLSQKFLLLVVVSSFLGSPIAYYFMKDWLQDFAYQVDITIITFLLTGMATLLIAFIAILFHSLRISIANPVNALRCD